MDFCSGCTSLWGAFCSKTTLIAQSRNTYVLCTSHTARTLCKTVDHRLFTVIIMFRCVLK